MQGAVQPGTRRLGVGVAAEVEVPATSANLGPGFDCFGLALDWRDRCRLEVVSGPDRAEVTGEGADRLPTDGTHLVLASARRALAFLGADAPGLLLRAHNTIPHGRGLGSSSAAIAAGLIGGAALAATEQGGRVEPADWLALATEIEGHPDNVAAALLGGFTVAYVPSGTASASSQVPHGGSEGVAGSAPVAAIRASVHPDIRALAFVPERPLSTDEARALLPDTVPHADAAANAGRSALLVEALTHDPSLLFEATVDRLHQRYRAGAMRASARLLESLRDKGCAAVISGAGPTVVVLGTEGQLAKVRHRDELGFAVSEHQIGPGSRVLSNWLP